MGPGWYLLPLAQNSADSVEHLVSYTNLTSSLDSGAVPCRICICCINSAIICESCASSRSRHMEARDEIDPPPAADELDSPTLGSWTTSATMASSIPGAFPSSLSPVYLYSEAICGGHQSLLAHKKIAAVYLPSLISPPICRVTCLALALSPHRLSLLSTHCHRSCRC